jgi:type IV secretory pathway VirD2 relaxase
VPKGDDSEGKFRLRPRKPSVRSERRAWASAYKLIMHYAHMSGARKRRSSVGSTINRTRPHFQRCAVRVMYSKNVTAGQWRAHGRYIARESATHERGPKDVGFDSSEESINIAARLEAWQKANDERFWKVIISPEFGDRADLKRLARDLISRTEKDLGTPVEWVAVAHYNTEHPHVHLALRGVGAQGRPIRLSPDYVKKGIRDIAEDLCTRQLGYRSELDAAVAQRREVHQHRFTSLDRIIKRDAENIGVPDPRFFTVVKDPGRAGPRRGVPLAERHTVERLRVLESMGLAESISPNTWRLRQDFENVLRAMQRGTDRQKTLAAHGVPISDERLQLVALDYRQLTTLEGRILVHGEEETGRDAGRGYLMLEATDGRIHYVRYTPEMEEARSRGSLRTNSFIRLQKVFSEGPPLFKIDDLGDSETILRNKRHLSETAQRLIRRGFSPQDDGWNGWLGRYQRALQGARITLEGPRLTREGERTKKAERDRGR